MVLSLLHYQITFEGWHKMWESVAHVLPQADLKWLKEDDVRALFQRATSYQDKHGRKKWRKVLKMTGCGFIPRNPLEWWDREIPRQNPFFHSNVFLET